MVHHGGSDSSCHASMEFVQCDPNLGNREALYSNHKRLTGSRYTCIWHHRFNRDVECWLNYLLPCCFRPPSVVRVKSLGLSAIFPTNLGTSYEKPCLVTFFLVTRTLFRSLCSASVLLPLCGHSYVYEVSALSEKTWNRFSLLGLKSSPR